MDGYYRVHIRLTARTDPLLLSVAECRGVNIAGLMRDSVNAFVRGEKLDIRIPPGRPCCESDAKDIIVAFRTDKDADAIRFLTERCAKPARAVKQIFTATIALPFSGSCRAGSALVPEGTVMPEGVTAERNASMGADERPEPAEHGRTGGKERGDAGDQTVAGEPGRRPGVHERGPARHVMERSAGAAETPAATAPTPDGADNDGSIWDMFDRV